MKEYIEYDNSLLLPINGFPGYWISNRGYVYSAFSRGIGINTKGLEMKPRHKCFLNTDSVGHLFMDFYKSNKNKKRVRKKVNYMVMEHFGPPKPEGKVYLRHLNDIQIDNRIENLEWGSPSENRKDFRDNYKKLKLLYLLVKKENPELIDILEEKLKEVDIAKRYDTIWKQIKDKI